jgi:hypothetical protein
MVNRSYVDSTDVDEIDAGTGTQYRSMTDRVAAIFDDRKDAERAIDWLRSRGVSNDSISVMAQDRKQTSDMAQRTGTESVASDPGSDMARGAGTGLAAGAGVGALFGLAAAMIPGIGPFITAGALANALGAAGGGAVAGAIVGGTSGAIAGVLSKWGLDQADADYYGKEIERGGTFVAVDLDGSSLTRAEVEDAFRRFNGRWASA